MKTTQSNANPNANASTTEELIVQYLDGELMRKELETVLFDRLARSEDARTLLREYLVVRGAIRMMREDERFQLAEDLDDRTRARIEQALAAIESPEPAVADATPSRGFLRDRGAIARSAAERRIQRWPRRTAYAALALLLMFGAWFVGKDSHSPQLAQSLVPSSHTTVPTASVPIAQAAPQSAMPAGTIASNAVNSVPKKMKAVHSVKTQHSPGRSDESDMASNASNLSQASVAQPQTQNSVQTPDPSDVMLSNRFAKAINSAKHEVVVSSRDRL